MSDLFLRTETARVAELYRCKVVEAQRRADASLRARVPQKPPDVGLFSDDAAQLGLVDMARRK